MRKLIWLYMIPLLMVSCDSDVTGEVSVVSKDFVNVVSKMELAAEGQDVELTVEANCYWNITVYGEWLTVSPLAGYKTQSIIISAGQNYTGMERTAGFMINGGTAPVRLVSITQHKTASPDVKTLSAFPSELVFEAAGETKTLTISSNTNWSITCPEWCSLSASSGSGNANITITATENNSKEKRVGSIVIAGNDASSVVVSLTQNAKEEKPGTIPGSDDNQPPS